MGELKPGWTRVKFGDVVRLVKETCKDPLAAGIERVIGLEHLEPGDLRIRTWANVADGTTFTTRVRPGQVLFGKRRAYQRKVAVAAFDAICSGDIYVLESADPTKLLPEVLPFICQTDRFFEHAVDTSAGSLSPRTNWSSLAGFEFPLPPLPKQRHIAACVRAIDAAIESLRLASRATNAVVDSIVEAAFDRWSEHLPPKRLTDGCERITDGTHQPPPFSDAGIPFFLVKTIAGGTVDWRCTKYVSAETYGQLTRRVRPKRGDVLYTAVGSYGVAVFVDFDEPFVFQRHIAHVIPDPEILLGEFVALFLNSSRGKRQSDRHAIGSAQPTVTLQSLSNFVLPFPSIIEQSDLLRKVADVRSAATGLASRHAEITALRHRALSESWP